MSYYHVLENGKREGKAVYEHVKTYRRWAMLMRYLLRDGAKPVWVVESETDYLQVEPDGMVGGIKAKSWNAGSGWGQWYKGLRTEMPRLPLADVGTKRIR